MLNNIETPSDDNDDLVWGAENIGREINRTAAQTRYLVSIGALQGAVRKIAHRTLVGSRRRLRGLIIKA
jgi:hypothetical protein